MIRVDYLIIEINELFLVCLKGFLFKIANLAKFLVNCFSSKSYDLLILSDIMNIAELHPRLSVVKGGYF
jgi:hypothetical protein